MELEQNPAPTVGHVVVMENMELSSAYRGPGMCADKQTVRALQVEDGPFILECWAVGHAVAYDPPFDGATPEDDPSAVELDGQQLVGRLADGATVLTSPVVEVRRMGPTLYVQVVDGLLFQLGTPNPDWVAMADDPEAMISGFAEAYAPLDLVGTSSTGRGLQ